MIIHCKPAMLTVLLFVYTYDTVYFRLHLFKQFLNIDRVIYVSPSLCLVISFLFGKFLIIISLFLLLYCILFNPFIFSRNLCPFRLTCSILSFRFFFFIFCIFYRKCLFLCFKRNMAHDKISPH